MKKYIHQRLLVPSERMNAVIDEWKVQHQDSFYDINTKREEMSKELRLTRTYNLRIPNVPKGFITKTTSASNVLDCIDTKLYDLFPALHSFIDWVGSEFYGGWTTLGRVIITKLPANSKIDPHIDNGLYFETLHRHHITLDTNDADFCWIEGRVKLSAGQLWVVNNSIPHWVVNNGPDRTHVIFDGA